MVGPLLPDLAVDSLVAVEHADLTETVVMEDEVSVRIPGTLEDTVTWVTLPEQPCRFSAAGAGGVNLRGDRPTAVGDYRLDLELGGVFGQRGLVRGVDRSGVAWQHLVVITKVLEPTETLSSALCVDPGLDPA